ncbi:MULTISPECIES: ribosome hibernation-promoting factor, HPF/YfiA family [unclassified Sphingomonas]|uniref:ribosome hibernation-promoting factor, HPF/YfiA family n=1 Tax=unclassified Sphingomonas TaxID=196159 RepID=UPI0006FB4D67|nr:MULTISPECIES: ribosome-associated translation inhibitor RaiA [unclassified Sphingomonas]KQX21538.1 30S ribosomal protein S30 [Sphingomonas sp. Root1294]KQY72855.1 30S ribosomal protein S30 [Sphingomonas sp. Root50]KRB88351.1 30S ribosomal protein S30 [Sphingomonas sp. Root720]
MEIRVSGHQVDTGEALRTHVETRLHAIADKFFSRSLSAHVTFGRGQHGNGFSCDIVAHVMHGVILKGSGQAMDAHPCFDQAADRIETQLRRYMNRLKSRSPAVPQLVDAAVDMADDNAGYTVFEAPPEEEVTGDSPVIIAETRVDVPDASVSDAVMMLDLRNTTALLFRNSGTGAFNMVYRRTDGTIGWVEPSRAAG